MTLENLGTGHIVTFRNGFKSMVYKGIIETRVNSTWILNTKLGIALPINEYTLNLKNSTNDEYDIMKVEALMGLREIQTPISEIKDTKVLWERPPVLRIKKSAIQETFGCVEFVIVEDE